MTAGEGDDANVAVPALGWKRVGWFVELRRGQLGFRRQEDAAEAAEIGVETWRRIENARQDGATPVILGAIARALKWPADMLPRIARGEDPPLEGSDLTQRVDRLEVRLGDVEGKVDQILDRLPSDEG